MEERQRTRICNGVFSAFILLSGIVVAVCIGLLFQKFGQAIGFSGLGIYLAFSSSPFWAVGFGFIIPGLLGVIGSLTKNKGCYIATLVFCILSLIIMGVFFFLGIFLILVLASLNTASCSGSSCDLAQEMYSLGVASIVFSVLGWIGTLATAITSGMLGCGRESAGVVIVPMGTVAGQPPGYNQGHYTGQPAPYNSYPNNPNVVPETSTGDKY